MGQTVSADKEALELRDLFHLDQASVQRVGGSGPAQSGDICTQHHVKAWKFERTAGRTVVDSPVVLCDENGVFTAELQKACSYLIMHVSSDDAQCERDSGDEGDGDMILATLEELAARASNVCSPRGLTIEATPQSEAAFPDDRLSTPGAPCRYAVFVWHGLDVDPHVKVRSLTRAIELERLLRTGLMRCRSFIESVERARPLKSARGAAPPGGRPSSAVTGNRLLASFLGGNSPAAVARDGTRGIGLNAAANGRARSEASGGVGAGQRFPRLGLSVCRSLGVKPAPMEAFQTEMRQLAPPQSTASPSRPPNLQQLGTPAPTISGSGTAVPSLMPGGLPQPTVEQGSTGVDPPRRAAPLVPRLQLGNALATSAHNEGNAMDVDEKCDSAGRKRGRGADFVPPRTARCVPPTIRSVGASTATTMVPKSARTDISSALQSSAMPGLNLGNVTDRGNTISGRSEPPVMLNLEEINMSEEELINLYDPENEENNYHLPHHLYKHLQLKQYKNICSEIMEKQLYLSSYQVATELDTLRRHGITHIVNTAGDVCENKFPDQFNYLLYYLKDMNNEDISLLFYRTIEWIHAAISRGGRVLVHCHAGVSRSSTMILSYIMWRFSLSFEQAHDRVRKVRPICNPNTGFTCQLLLHAKKLGLTGACGQAAAPYERPPAIFRVAPYHPKEPFLLLQPAECSPNGAWPLFDPRFAWVAQRGTQLVLWLGSQVPDKEAAKAAVSQHARWLLTFERCNCSIVVTTEGAETAELWQALGTDGAGRQGLAATKPCYDADYEVLLASSRSTSDAGARSAPDDDRPPVTARPPHDAPTVSMSME